MSPVVRPATLADVEVLIELASATFRDTYCGTDDAADIALHVSRHFTRSAFEEILADSSMTLHVADAGGRLVGYLQTKRSPAPACVTGSEPIELSRLYLRRETQGMGLGAALMHTMFAQARRQACETIWLVVYSRNDKAREFYRRWGFADIGLTDFQFGGTVYSDPVMSVRVGPG